VDWIEVLSLIFVVIAGDCVLICRIAVEGRNEE